MQNDGVSLLEPVRLPLFRYNRLPPFFPLDCRFSARWQFSEMPIRRRAARIVSSPAFQLPDMEQREMYHTFEA
jgi:hypothetical protein